MLVPGVGVEPTRCVAPKDFKSFASTSFATRASFLFNNLSLPILYPWTFRKIFAKFSPSSFLRWKNSQPPGAAAHQAA